MSFSPFFPDPHSLISQLAGGCVAPPLQEDQGLAKIFKVITFGACKLTVRAKKLDQLKPFRRTNSDRAPISGCLSGMIVTKARICWS